jgi:beta-lactamase class A
VTILVSGYWVSSLYQAPTVSPLADDFGVPTPTQVLTQTQTRQPLLGFLSKSKKPDELRTIVKAVADPKWKNYSVMIVDLNSNFQMTINESAIFDGASVNKIPILVTLYHMANEGTIDLNKTITMQARDVQDYGTGSMRYDRPGSVYSIKTLALLMIQKSDNTAAYILANHVVGLSKIQSYIESLGTTQTDMEENTTSNKDIALLFKQMFEGKVTNAALSAEMIGFLKDTDFEDRLPAQLPEDVFVYHKIGTGIGAVHDVGVVEFGKTKYYIGIFTSNITDEERTSEEVAAVSKTIFEFMNN